MPVKAGRQKALEKIRVLAWSFPEQIVSVGAAGKCTVAAAVEYAPDVRMPFVL